MSSADLVVLFLAIAVMLFTALLCGQLARKLGLPSLLGELIGGILLGPTALGWLSPGLYGWLFPSSGPAFQGLEALSKISVLFFLFAVGLEMSPGLIRKRWSGIAWTSLAGLAIPFTLGCGLVLLSPGLFGGLAQRQPLLMALFMGTALSISALPVIARILMDLGLLKTELGMIVMGAATVDDLVGWSLFAFILGSFTSGRVLSLPPYATLVLVLLLFAIMLTIGRYSVQRLGAWLRPRLSWPGGFLGVAIAFMLAISALTEAIGVDAVFGAFLAGLALSPDGGKPDEAHSLLYQFVTGLFAPLYFVSIGLRVDFVRSFDPALVGLVLLVACAGKIAGATLGARIGRLPLRQAAAVGFAMNARGAMVMILAAVARGAGLIDDRVFVALIIMALVTTVLSGPIIGRLIAGAPEKPAPVAPDIYLGLADIFREED